jgi:hypothetical protein
MTDPNGGPTAEELRSIADEIAKTGRLEITRAELTASRWAAWASKVHRLVDEMPAIGASPSYMAEDGRPMGVRFHIDTEDAQLMKQALIEVTRTADAVMGAWIRAATDLDGHVRSALGQVDADPEHYASLRPPRDGGR